MKRTWWALSMAACFLFACAGAGCDSKGGSGADGGDGTEGIDGFDDGDMDDGGDVEDGGDTEDGGDVEDGGSGEDGGDAGCTGDGVLLGPMVLDHLVYEGAFRLSSADFGVSSTNYAIGTLAYNPAHHSLFIAGHDHHNAVAEFDIPTPGQADQVADLPLVDTPRQVFHQVLDESPNGNPEGIDRITGMLVRSGQLIINAETWYDADGQNRDTTLVVRDADDLGGAIDGYFELACGARCAGYMGPIPDYWQCIFGGDTLSGWSSVYSIISRYSVGPSLWTFDPEAMLDAAPGSEGPVGASAIMDFDYGAGHYLDPDALTAEQGGASDLWNFLSDGVYGFIVPQTSTFAVFGSSGGVDSGIGYKITQDDGNLCGGYCSYAAADNYNYYWFFDLYDIIGADAVWDIQPYAHGRWSVPFDGDGAHKIIGGTFDPDTRTLYLALGGAGQVGEYDRPPLIVVYHIMP